MGFFDVSSSVGRVSVLLCGDLCVLRGRKGILLLQPYELGLAFPSFPL